MSKLFTKDEMKLLEDWINKFPLDPDAEKYNEFVSNLTPDRVLRHLADYDALQARAEAAEAREAAVIGLLSVSGKAVNALTARAEAAEKRAAELEAREEDGAK